MSATVHHGLRRLLTRLSRDMLLGRWQTRRRLPGGKMIQLLEWSDDFPIEAKSAALKDLSGASPNGQDSLSPNDTSFEIACAHELIEHPTRPGRIVVHDLNL